jgi:hypothetical protein
MADQWTFAAGATPPGGTPSVALSNARGRTLTMRVAADQGHEADFTLDGKDPQAADFTELASDLWVYRAGFPLPLFQGRIGPTTDTLTDAGHQVAVTASDYRALLGRRRLFTGDTLSWASVEQALICWQMIQATQGRAGGNLGIVPGLGQVTGVARTLAYAAGDFIGADITATSQLDTGFDWDISPYGSQDLRFDVFYPFRGTSRGVVLEYGGSLAKSITRAVDPGAYANALLVTGDSSATLTPAQPEAADIATRPEGRWDQVVGTTQLTASGLASRAAWELADAEVITPAYTVVMQPQAWQGPGHIWIGDQVQVRIASGRLAVDAPYRVLELAVAIGDDGDERVTLQVGAIPVRPLKVIADAQRRLRFLETR